MFCGWEGKRHHWSIARKNPLFKRHLLSHTYGCNTLGSKYLAGHFDNRDDDDGVGGSVAVSRNDGINRRKNTPISYLYAIEVRKVDARSPNTESKPRTVE